MSVCVCVCVRVCACLRRECAHDVSKHPRPRLLSPSPSPSVLRIASSLHCVCSLCVSCSRGQRLQQQRNRQEPQRRRAVVVFSRFLSLPLLSTLLSLLFFSLSPAMPFVPTHCAVYCSLCMLHERSPCCAQWTTNTTPPLHRRLSHCRLCPLLCLAPRPSPSSALTRL